MSYNFEYPIDDDTLFILLALRYDGELEIAGLDSVYDGLVNYDCTLLKQDSKKGNTLDFAGKAIAWVRDEFEVSIEETDDILYLREPNAQKLKNFLDEYFTEFRIYKNYYHTLDEHKEVFVKFIEYKFQNIVEYKKTFVYRITQDKQFKMVQYIGYLMSEGILEAAGEDKYFSFNNDGNLYRKVIGLKFSAGYDIANFFHRRKYKGRFYILDDDTNVYLTETNTALDIFGPDLLPLLRYCIDKDINNITIDIYSKVRQQVGKNKKILKPEQVRKYMYNLNEQLQDITNVKKNFVYSQNRNGVWKLDLS